MKRLLAFIFLIASCNLAAEEDLVLKEISEQYVKLVLAMGNHDPAYVDAYYGPKEWAENAKQKQIPLKNIIIASKFLIDNLEGAYVEDEMINLRLRYLDVQLSALHSKAIMLKNELRLDFDQESKVLYNTQAPSKKLSDFDPILAQLDKMLPGNLPLAEKANAFKSQFIIPKEKLQQVFDIAIAECRKRTQVYIDLLQEENFKLEFVTDKPWSGYNWYKGNSFSLIQVNTELPIYISRAIDLGCHEGYPGHHTYNALLEANLVKKRGWVEFSVYPLFSPQSVIAEGTANYGIEMAFPGNEKVEFEKKALFPVAGIDPKLADSFAAFTQLTSQLSYAGNEVARLYLNKKIERDAAVELLQKYTLVSPQKANQRVDFYDTYGAYVINYNWGKELVKQWVESGEDQSIKGRWKRFSQLLASPRLPSTLK
jgi:hypothetical protein